VHSTCPTKNNEGVAGDSTCDGPTGENKGDSDSKHLTSTENGDAEEAWEEYVLCLRVRLMSVVESWSASKITRSNCPQEKRRRSEKKIVPMSHGSPRDSNPFVRGRAANPAPHDVYSPKREGTENSMASLNITRKRKHGYRLTGAL